MTPCANSLSNKGVLYGDAGQRTWLQLLTAFLPRRHRSLRTGEATGLPTCPVPGLGPRAAPHGI